MTTNIDYISFADCALHGFQQTKDIRALADALKCLIAHCTEQENKISNLEKQINNQPALFPSKN
jgi:hypothetical protein